MRFLTPFILVSLLISLSLSAADKPAKYFNVQYEKEVLFTLSIDESGEVTKTYPKPAARLGKIAIGEDRKRHFSPVDNLADNYFPLTANIVLAAKLSGKSSDNLRTLIQGEKNRIIAPAGDLRDAVKEFESWTGPKLELDWKKLALVEVAPKELTKIQTFEKGLPGKWKFTEGTYHTEKTKTPIGEISEIVPLRAEMELCADGTCLPEKKLNFYWVDGKFKRLSFQESLKSEDYSQTYEYDIVTLGDDELVVRSLDLKAIPSRLKGTEEYTVPPVHSIYRFKRIKK